MLNDCLQASRTWTVSSGELDADEARAEPAAIADTMQPPESANAAAPADASAEVAQLRAQVRQLEQDLVSSALATNDDQLEALTQVRPAAWLAPS